MPHELEERCDEAQLAELVAFYLDEPCGSNWLAVSAIIQAITDGFQGYLPVARTNIEDFAYLPLAWPRRDQDQDGPTSFENIVNQFGFAGLLKQETK